MNSINTNNLAINAQRNLARTEKTLSTSMERLSSGKRINSARDDAAGLAIALKFAAQVVGADQAARNANDGISMLQTAEGGMQEVTQNLQRMRELAVQAANGTYTASDRAAMNQEYEQMQASIRSTIDSTEFNGHKVLNDAASIELQVGADAESAGNKTAVGAVDLLANADIQNVLTNSALSDQTLSSDAIAKIDAALDHVSAESARFGAMQNRLESTISNLQTSSEKSSAARSRIEDTDYAKEMSELTRSLILQKSTLAMAGHANASNQLVAGLLNRAP